MSARILRLTPDDAARYARLRLRMLQDAPWSFAASPQDDVALKLDQLAEYLADEEQAILAIEAADLVRPETSTADSLSELAAAAGLMRMKQAKFAHRALLWGVFVDSDRRRRGLGRLLVRAAIDLALTWVGVDDIDLGVSENAPAARALYESFGFRAWGREPEATACDGRRYDEIHMTLRLKPVAERPAFDRLDQTAGRIS